MSSLPLPGSAAAAAAPPGHAWRTILRHRWPLRWMHWINLLCMLAMVGSGLQIFNAHPALYWGQASHFQTPLAALQSKKDAGGALRGVTRIGHASFDTTGVLGASKNMRGEVSNKGFPDLVTIPGSRNLAFGRRWHFFFAWLWVVNGAVYLAWSLGSRHLGRDLAMRKRDWRGIPRSIVDHLRFRHPVGEEAARYNPLQKLAYLSVIFGLTPLIVITGLAMSPQMDSGLGWFLSLVGGRQSARTLHFVAMAAFVLFAIVHVVMVFYAGPINEMRSMITGKFRIREVVPPVPAAAQVPESPKEQSHG